MKIDSDLQNRAYDITVSCMWQFFGRWCGNLSDFRSVFGNLLTETKNRNFMKNEAYETVIRDTIDGITVITNLYCVKNW